jgi:starch synthase
MVLLSGGGTNLQALLDAEKKGNLNSGLGSGNGFTFADYDADALLRTIRRAVAGYADQAGWQVLVKRAMACDFSWGKSANAYIRLYKSLLSRKDEA